jgi:hypothetical protein
VLSVSGRPEGYGGAVKHGDISWTRQWALKAHCRWFYRGSVLPGFPAQGHRYLEITAGGIPGVTSDTVYEETIPFRLGLIAVGIFSAFAVLMLVLLVLQLTSGPLGSRPAPDWFYIVMFVFLSAIGIFVTNFRKLTIRFTSQSITVAFGMLKRTIPWGDIEDCSRDESSAFAYSGWGIRIARVKGRWRLVYNVVGYPGVLLSLRAGRFREFVFSTKNVEQVLDIIRRQASVNG